MIAPLEKGRQSGSLSFEKFKQLEKANLLLETLKKKYKESLAKLEAIKKQISELGNGTINIKQTAYTGVKINIGSETLILQKEHDYVSFLKDADGITFIPLIRGE